MENQMPLHDPHHPKICGRDPQDWYEEVGPKGIQSL